MNIRTLSITATLVALAWSPLAAEAATGTADVAKGRGPVAAEEATHLQRCAQLDRLEALATEKGNAKLLEQVARMRAQEAERHERVLAAHGKGKGHGKPDDKGKPNDKGKKPEDMGKKPEDMGGKKPDGAGKPEDMGKKPEDMGKKPEDMGKKPEDMGGKKPDGAGKPDGKGKP